MNTEQAALIRAGILIAREPEWTKHLHKAPTLVLDAYTREKAMIPRRARYRALLAEYAALTALDTHIRYEQAFRDIITTNYPKEQP